MPFLDLPAAFLSIPADLVHTIFASRTVRNSIVLADRSISRIAAAVVGRQHYAAFVNMLRLYPRPASALRRYLTGGGTYPIRFPVRTPLGTVRPMLFSHHDLLTLNEVFCRRDYPADRATRVVVDIGSNIGLSALYFLTRDESVRTYLFEPVPSNLPRLRENLHEFDGRYHLHPCAVAASAGRVSFGIEPTGRYGGIGVATGASIDVECRGINEVLEQVLLRHDRIDLLKIDTEGAELATVGAMSSDIRSRIGRICIEARPETPLFPGEFAQRQYGSVCRLTRVPQDR